MWFAYILYVHIQGYLFAFSMPSWSVPFLLSSPSLYACKYKDYPNLMKLWGFLTLYNTRASDSS